MKNNSIFHSKSIKVQTIINTFLTFVQKAFSFIRSAVCAAIFGVTALTDAFYMASDIVILLSNLPGALSTGMIPVRAKEAAEGGEKQADAYTSTILNLALITAAVLSGFVFLFAPMLISLFAPGFHGETRVAAILMLRILTPYILLMAISFTLTAMLNYHKLFYVGSLTGIAFNVLWLAVPLIFWRYIGIYAMAAGYLIGAAAQAVSIWFALRKKFSYFLCFDIKNPAIKNSFSMIMPVYLSISMNMISQAVDKILASTLQDGSVSALSYAQQVMTLIIALAIDPVIIVAFTFISKYAQKGMLDEVKSILLRVMTLVILVMLPATIYCIMFGDAIISIIFGRGKFDAQSIYITSIPLAYYSLGLAAVGVTSIVTKVFHAFLDAKTPVKASFIGIVTNLALNIILVKHMGIGGLALATSISGMLSAVILVILIRMKLGALGFSKLTISLIKILLASAALATVAYIFKTRLELPLILKAAVSLVGSGIAYFFALLLLKQEDVMDALYWSRELLLRREI